ncbi:MAG: hypothetical protein HY706_03495 [Candidatus Hydrogenedentes bacterium]|nr:hypothetical protein [Candidatus Hydrogenedentota bacterium]
MILAEQDSRRIVAAEILNTTHINPNIGVQTTRILPRFQPLEKERALGDGKRLRVVQA